MSLNMCKCWTFSDLSVVCHGTAHACLDRT